MKKTLIAGSIMLLSSIAVSAQQKPIAKNEKTIIIGPKLEDCVGVAPMKCMQVKESRSQKEWHNFYNKIEGFKYKPGYEYVLKVKTEKIKNPPADASSIKYTLIKQISKTKK